MITFNVIRYKNFLSTGSRFTEIYLNNTRTTLVLGDNGSGKSTMLDALTFALFSKPFRRINKPQLVNSINERECVAEVEFEIGSKEYLVRRGIRPNIFEIYIDGRLMNQDAKSRDYQDILEKQVLKLNYKSFTQIILLGSSSFLPFMQLPSNHRREIIEDLLDIQVFSLMNQLLKIRSTENRGQSVENSNSLELNEEKINVQKKYMNEVLEINNDKIQKTKDKIAENNRNTETLLTDKSEAEEKVSTLLEEYYGHSEWEQKVFKMYGYQGSIEGQINKLEKSIKFFEHETECPKCKQSIGAEHKKPIVTDNLSQVEELKIGVELIVKAIDEEEKRDDYWDDVEESLERAKNSVRRIESNIGSNKSMNRVMQEEIEYLEKVKDKSIDDNERLKILNEEKVEFLKRKDEFMQDKLYYETANELLKDTGIKTRIVRQYLPIMNRLINKHLSAMDSYFDFTLDEEFNEVIRSRHRDEFSYASFSEGEKMRIDLALLFTWRAVAKLKNSANTNLLVLDEVFDSSLDSTGTEEFMKLINSLDDSINVFVISHKGDTLYDRFDEVIKFEKVQNFSKVI
ncbi:MAG: recombinase [Acidobacteria bacterium]|nr:recombinase [Acidobacteriota bacterium]